MILAIDPSFTSTGVSLHQDDGTLIDYIGIHEGGEVYKSNALLHQACDRILYQIANFIAAHYNKLTVIIETPAPNTSGWYLAILHGWLVSSFFNDENTVSLVTVPPLACDSFISNRQHSKSYIVKYAKEHGWMPEKRINNDIATAVCLAHLYLSYKKGEYKNTVNIVK